MQLNVLLYEFLLALTFFTTRSSFVVTILSEVSFSHDVFESWLVVLVHSLQNLPPVSAAVVVHSPQAIHPQHDLFHGSTTLSYQAMDFDLDPWITLGSSGASVRLTPPPLSFLRVPPSEIPQTLPPPSDHPTLAHPFTIPIDVYNAALSPNVPILAALVYTTTVHLLNGMNEKRSYKPWAFSRTHFFRFMVIIHNITLALYSAWTCMGMINVLTISFYSPWDEHGLAGTVDSLCKIHGPRGPGSAAIFEESTSTWTIANRFFHLGPDGLTPDSTDVGRIWNEGLAFYGWLFYLSKFYEVIDTLIILAKGKKSSFLQTYHHAGAMICMWAGIRYMSPPIWMFVLVNSFIHSIMVSSTYS